MAYLVKKHNTSTGSDGEHRSLEEGTVVSDWELSDHIRKQIDKGVDHFRQLFEPLTEVEARNMRIKATRLEGARTSNDGAAIQPPFDDYVGLHPKEVTERMREADRGLVNAIREYERLGLNREPIINFVAPAEREPFSDYDELGVREIIDKMALLDDKSNQEIILYEMDHLRRPAIITWDRNTYERGATPEPQQEAATA